MAETENHSIDIESGTLLGKIDLRGNQPERDWLLSTDRKSFGM